MSEVVAFKERAKVTKLSIFYFFSDSVQTLLYGFKVSSRYNRFIFRNESSSTSGAK